MIPGGFDLNFTLSNLDNNCSLFVSTNAQIENDTSPETFVSITRIGGDLIIAISPGNVIPLPWLEAFTAYGAHASSMGFRITGHNNFFSVTIDNSWSHTFGFTSVEWGDPKELYLSKDSINATVTNLVSSELFSWRPAIYVELEATASSGIRSVIQERPIEEYPASSQMLYSYNAIRSTAIAQSKINSHSIRLSDSQYAASDAILYYSDVAVVSSSLFEEEYGGFATKVLRLSNLDADAKLAGRTILQRAAESMRLHSIRMRYDPRLQVGDKFVIQYERNMSTVTETIIVEDISITVSDAVIQMNVEGRNVYT